MRSFAAWKKDVISLVFMFIHQLEDNGSVISIVLVVLFPLLALLLLLKLARIDLSSILICSLVRHKVRRLVSRYEILMRRVYGELYTSEYEGSN